VRRTPQPAEESVDQRRRSGFTTYLTADEMIFWDSNNSTADDPISKRAGFGIFQEFRERSNALQTFSTLIIIHENGKIMIYIEILVLKDSSDLVKHFRCLLK
jgi:hypothetical protein